MKERYSIIKEGYVTEDEEIIDSKTVESFSTKAKADKHLSDYDDTHFVERQTFDGLYWVAD